MAQTNLSLYGFRLDVAQAGQIYGLSDHVIDSLTATADVAFGAPVEQGASDEVGATLNALTDNFVGVAVFTQAVGNDGSRTGYKNNERMSVMRKGRVWVTVAANVTKEADAYVTAGGTFNVTNTGIRVGKFLTTTSNGGLAVLELSGSPVKPA